jgi:hypothetical protein
MACTSCGSNTVSSTNLCGCKDLPLTTAATFTCPPDITCPDPTPCYETIQDTCVKHSSLYSIYQFGNWFGNEGDSYPALPAGASLENAYQAMSVQSVDTDCLPPINVHPTYVGTTTIILTWELTGADTYRVDYGTVPGTWTTTAALTTNSYTFTLLNPNTNYYFQVRTFCGEGPTSTSAIIIIKTLPLPL